MGQRPCTQQNVHIAGAGTSFFLAPWGAPGSRLGRAWRPGHASADSDGSASAALRCPGPRHALFALQPDLLSLCPTGLQCVLVLVSNETADKGLLWALARRASEVAGRPLLGLCLWGKAGATGLTRTGTPGSSLITGLQEELGRGLACTEGPWGEAFSHRVGTLALSVLRGGYYLPHLQTRKLRPTATRGFLRVTRCASGTARNQICVGLTLTLRSSRCALCARSPQETSRPGRCVLLGREPGSAWVGTEMPQGYTCSNLRAKTTRSPVKLPSYMSGVGASIHPALGFRVVGTSQGASEGWGASQTTKVMLSCACPAPT